MEKFEFEDEIYYADKGCFYDSSFIEVPFIDRENIASAYYKEKAQYAKTADDYIQLTRDMKNAGCNKLSIDYCLKFLEIAESDLNFNRGISIILSILSSNYRKINEPKKAIDLINKYNRNDWNSTFLTSVAAAYCDIGDYGKAKKFADTAYAMQGGGVNYKNELSLVYKRIQKETGEKPFES